MERPHGYGCVPAEPGGVQAGKSRRRAPAGCSARSRAGASENPAPTDRSQVRAGDRRGDVAAACGCPGSGDDCPDLGGYPRLRHGGRVSWRACAETSHLRDPILVGGDPGQRPPSLCDGWATFKRDAGEAPPLHLFGQLKPISRQWLDTCLVCRGGTYPTQLLRFSESSTQSGRSKPCYATTLAFDCLHRIATGSR